MSSEEEIIIAFLFKRSGKKELPLSELSLTLSMDLKWFTPSFAKKFIMSAIQKGLLHEKNGMLSPLFNIDSVMIPFGFHPSQKRLEEIEPTQDKKRVLEKIIDFIAEETGKDRKEIAETIEGIGKEKNIIFEVAALLLGKQLNVELKGFLEEVELKIFTENTE